MSWKRVVSVVIVVLVVVVAVGWRLLAQWVVSPQAAFLAGGGAAGSLLAANCYVGSAEAGRAVAQPASAAGVLKGILEEKLRNGALTPSQLMASSAQ